MELLFCEDTLLMWEIGGEGPHFECLVTNQALLECRSLHYEYCC